MPADLTGEIHYQRNDFPVRFLRQPNNGGAVLILPALAVPKFAVGHFYSVQHRRKIIPCLLFNFFR
jgi:hypothetical protein